MIFEPVCDVRQATNSQEDERPPELRLRNPDNDPVPPPRLYAYGAPPFEPEPVRGRTPTKEPRSRVRFEPEEIGDRDRAGPSDPFVKLRDSRRRFEPDPPMLDLLDELPACAFRLDARIASSSS